MKPDDKTILTQAEVLKRMEHYCAYQDRCHRDVWEKLREYALDEQEKENIICRLIEDRFLDEERFARSFVRGKHRFKQWGRLRLERELRLRGIHPRLVAEALDEVPEEEYRETFRELFRARAREAGGVETRAQMAKVYRFMVSKGYDPEWVWQALNVK